MTTWCRYQPAGAIAAGDLDRTHAGRFPRCVRPMRDDPNATVDPAHPDRRPYPASTVSINLAAGEIASGNTDLSPYRAAGGEPGRDRSVDGGADLHGAPERRPRRARPTSWPPVHMGWPSQGGEVVGQVVTTMTAIEASSKKIAEIIR